MAAVKRTEDLSGKRVLIVFRTTHIDRAGETGTDVVQRGEVVAVEETAAVVILTADGVHLRCPIRKLFRVRRGELATPTDYFAAEELIRDFHSATRPLVLRWLGRRAALSLCQASGDQ